MSTLLEATLISNITGTDIVPFRASPVVFEAGQHDTLDRDTAAFCAYFAA